MHHEVCLHIYVSYIMFPDEGEGRGSYIFFQKYRKLYYITVWKCTKRFPDRAHSDTTTWLSIAKGVASV